MWQRVRGWVLEWEGSGGPPRAAGEAKCSVKYRESSPDKAPYPPREISGYISGHRAARPKRVCGHTPKLVVTPPPPSSRPGWGGGRVRPPREGIRPAPLSNALPCSLTAPPLTPRMPHHPCEAPAAKALPEPPQSTRGAKARTSKARRNTGSSDPSASTKSRKSVSSGHASLASLVYTNEAGSGLS